MDKSYYPDTSVKTPAISHFKLIRLIPRTPLYGPLNLAIPTVGITWHKKCKISIGNKIRPATS